MFAFRSIIRGSIDDAARWWNTVAASNQRKAYFRMATPDSTTKHCRKCGKEYPATPEYFFRDKRREDGLDRRCKWCVWTPKREVLPDGYKRCTGCKEVLPATTEFFWCRKKGTTELFSKCITCGRTESREYRRKWRQENPELAREIGRIDQQKYRKKNPEKASARSKAGRIRRLTADPEKERARLRAKWKRWFEADPTKHRQKARRNNDRRRARKRGNTTLVHYTKADVERQFNLQSGCCYYCGISVLNNFQVDHFIPLSRGGSNAADNIVISCPKCNFSKGNKLPSEWKPL